MMCDVNTKIIGNIWFKEMIFEHSGDVKNGHKHTHDHITFVTNGSIEVFVIQDKDTNISKGIFKAPCQIKVPAGTAHTVVSLEDNTIAYCLEAVRIDDEIITTEFSNSEWTEPQMNEVDPLLSEHKMRKDK